MSSWIFVTLELAPSADDREGSACRGYLLRIPVNGSGHIDEAMVRTEPRRATVRRFWPSQPDQSGYLARIPHGWRFCDVGNDATERCFASMSDCRMVLGATVEVTGPDNQLMPFIVADLVPE